MVSLIVTNTHYLTQGLIIKISNGNGSVSQATETHQFMQMQYYVYI